MRERLSHVAWMRFAWLMSFIAVLLCCWWATMGGTAGGGIILSWFDTILCWDWDGVIVIVDKLILLLRDKSDEWNVDDDAVIWEMLPTEFDDEDEDINVVFTLLLLLLFVELVSL